VGSRSICAAIGLLALLFAASAPADHSNLEHVSLGPVGGNGPAHATFAHVSSDGGRVVFRTTESLVSADTDSHFDLYQRSAGVTTLISTSVVGGNGPFGAWFEDASEDGTRVLFRTDEQLSASDLDSTFDIYERFEGSTTLISTGPAGGNGPFYPLPDNTETSADATHVFFETREQLTTNDSDADGLDIYERFSGSTTLVSTGPAGGNGEVDAWLNAVSADGNRVVFSTEERLTSDDTDAVTEIYLREGGSLERLSLGPEGGNAANGAATFTAASRSADKVFFYTHEKLTADDNRSTCGFGSYWEPCPDIYGRTGGTTVNVAGPQVSGGYAGFEGISRDGDRVFYFTGDEQLPGSNDRCGQDEEDPFAYRGCADLFEYRDGTRRLLSPGGPTSCWPHNVPDCTPEYAGSSADGSRVYFVTSGAWTSGDNDPECDPDEPEPCYDVYESTAAHGVRLVSTGPQATPSAGAVFEGVSDDGERVFFSSAGAFVPQDTDTNRDVYEWSTGSATTTLVSGGAVDAFYKGASADGKRVIYETAGAHRPSDTDAPRVDVYKAEVASTVGHPRPAGATPLRVSLVPAYQPCTAPNREHGPPLAFGSCAPPAPRSTNLAMGVGDISRSLGHVRLAVLPGVPGGTDDTDVRIQFRLSNVMRTSDLSQYTGELRASAEVRLTDREGVGSQSTHEFPFEFDVPCVITDPANNKSLCELTTTLDAVRPGAAAEGTRAIWALDQMKVHDGGPDEDADTTSDNSLFAVQGIFVP
jgi:hypothetical protein